MMTRARVIFRGRVQGVYFRHYTREYSVEEGLTGWVRNEADGSVTALFEGEREAIEKVLRRLREDHPHARVDAMEASWCEGEREFDSFDVSYRSSTP